MYDKPTFVIKHSYTEMLKMYFYVLHFITLFQSMEKLPFTYDTLYNISGTVLFFIHLVRFCHDQGTHTHFDCFLKVAFEEEKMNDGSE